MIVKGWKPHKYPPIGDQLSLKHDTEEYYEAVKKNGKDLWIITENSEWAIAMFKKHKIVCII